MKVIEVMHFIAKDNIFISRGSVDSVLCLPIEQIVALFYGKSFLDNKCKVSF